MVKYAMATGIPFVVLLVAPYFFDTGPNSGWAGSTIQAVWFFALCSTFSLTISLLLLALSDREGRR